eukprot:scaffold411931_cov19-Prasinocladus_malaysianus.AAC.2
MALAAAALRNGCIAICPCAEAERSAVRFAAAIRARPCPFLRRWTFFLGEAEMVCNLQFAVCTFSRYIVMADYG